MNKPEALHTFDHNGVTITLTGSGRFTAEGPNGKITSASLEGIKKRLDEGGVFTPFKAFTLRPLYRGAEMESVTVVGFAAPRRRYGSREWKIVDSGGHKSQLSEVYEDTPANREAAKAYLDAMKEHRKVREHQDQLEQKLLGKVKSRRPEGKKS